MIGRRKHKWFIQNILIGCSFAFNSQTYGDVFWTQLLKVVREQNSISREVKIRKEHMPKDLVEIVLQLLRAVTVCVCSVEEPGTAALRVLTWELLSLRRTELKAQSLSVPWCYFLFFLSLWQDSQDREHHLPWEVPVVACRTGGERTAVCWVAQESSSELRKETPVSSLSGHMSTASPGNVNSAALSPPFAWAVGEPALTVQPCRCCWA